MKLGGSIFGLGPLGRLGPFDRKGPKGLKGPKALAAIATAVILGALCAFPAWAQEAPPPPKPAVKLQFLPPPMAGTISMGIFDSTGKLVRTLHSEAAVESAAFFKEINGLVTFWDGKDDAGNLMPAGKYSARGLMVGDLQIEGEAFHCNDWAADDKSPRIRRVTDLGAFSDTIALGLTLADGKTAQAQCAASGTLELRSEASPDPVAAPVVRDGKMPARAGIDGTPIATAEGRNMSVWVIDRVQDGATEVKQYSSTNEFLRRLAIDPTQPLPSKIAASKTADAICLLEENAQCQRFRWLELSQAESTTAGQPVSTWKELLRKTITFSDSFTQVQAELKMPGGKPVSAQERLAISLIANPLLQDKVTKLEVSLGTDSGGSFLKTADGLFLKRITDTPLLKWAVMDREAGSKTVVIFQGDGAVVEEFRIGRIGNMMAFDYGEFQFNPGK